MEWVANCWLNNFMAIVYVSVNHVGDHSVSIFPSFLPSFLLAAVPSIHHPIPRFPPPLPITHTTVFINISYCSMVFDSDIPHIAPTNPWPRVTMILATSKLNLVIRMVVGGGGRGTTAAVLHSLTPPTKTETGTKKMDQHYYLSGGNGHSKSHLG